MIKQKLTLSIDQEVLKEAKKLDINISSFLEVRLTDYIANKKGLCSRREGSFNLLVKKVNNIKPLGGN